MRLVYIYIDFTIGGKNPDGYRNYKKCGLNFGTEYYFKMSEPSEDNPNYELKCSARPAGERIETGFWGNDRLYNISALVGDNGVGKSTIIHEIIRCLHSSSFKNNRANSLFAILMQDHTGKYYLHHSLSTPIKVSLDASDRMHLDDNLQQLTNNGTPISANAFASKNPTEDLSIKIHPLIEKSKIIYFSNALTLSDQRLFETFTDIDSASYYETLQYTRPLYDCSLIADIISAIRISHASNATISKHFNTYFNFRSYQEARYLFDRNQRETLKKLKTKYEYPVPVPKNLNIHISPSISRLYNLLVREKIEYHQNNNKELIIKEFDVFRDAYKEFIKQSAIASVVIAELCLNSIACFMLYVGEHYGHESIQIPRIPLDFNRNFFLKFLESLYPEDITNYDTAKEAKSNCQDYINNLWNNKNIIELYCKDINISITEGVNFNITLGDNIDKILVEYMIRFINLTRAVSIMDYFVIYNWGLSSGESNLLHMFTKLRYLLTGSCYDSCTPTDTITIDNTDSVPFAIRQEVLANDYGHERREICDSVILFIDEADLTLHPDWQRQFVAILASFLPELFLNPYHEDTTKGCKDIQIILGTHSPIMLGDFPAASVIYLQKTKDGAISVNDRNSMQTFGQNIYTILQNGFYLQKGTFGELTQQKIKSVLDDIHVIRHEDSEYPMKPDTAKRLIERLNSHLRLTVQYLPEGAIKNKLTEEISISKARLKGFIPCEDSYSAANLANAERIRQLEKENAELKYQLLKLQNKESLNDPN